MLKHVVYKTGNVTFHLNSLNKLIAVAIHRLLFNLR